MNILDEANKIVNMRSDEKERQYGSFSEGMERAAKILSSLRGKEFDAHDMYAAMIALKMSRQSFNFKEDNLLDATAYMGAWQNYINEQKSLEEENKKNQKEKMLIVESFRIHDQISKINTNNLSDIEYFVECYLGKNGILSKLEAAIIENGINIPLHLSHIRIESLIKQLNDKLESEAVRHEFNLNLNL